MSTATRRVLLPSSIALMLVFAFPAAGEQSLATVSGDGNAQFTSNSGKTFNVDVNLVNLYFVTKGKHGALVPNLTPDQFEVLENGKAQTIKYFKSTAAQPLTLGLLVDTSRSERRVLSFEQQVGTQFLNEALQTKDLAFLISFDVEVDLMHDLTGPGGALTMALHQMQINAPPDGAWISGSTGEIAPRSAPGALLYDAIYLACSDKMRHEVGRKVLIILTDGFDQGSQATMRQAIESAQTSDTSVYVLLLFNPVFGSDVSDMRRLCKETGGRMMMVDKKADNRQLELQQLCDELRSQYYIGYVSTDKRADGTFRKVEVRTKESGYHIQVRKGYYAPKG